MIKLIVVLCLATAGGLATPIHTKTVRSDMMSHEGGTIEFLSAKRRGNDLVDYNTWVKVGGRYLRYFSYLKTFNEALAFCQKLNNATLVIDNHAAVHAYLKIISGKPQWIGAKDDDGTWRWLNGNPVENGISYWSEGEPSGNYHCLKINKGGWANTHCNLRYTFACQRDMGNTFSRQPKA